MNQHVYMLCNMYLCVQVKCMTQTMNQDVYMLCNMHLCVQVKSMTQTVKSTGVYVDDLRMNQHMYMLCNMFFVCASQNYDPNNESRCVHVV